MSKYLPINLFIRQGLLYPLTSPFLPPVNKVEEDYSYAAGRLIGTLEAPVARGVPKTGQTILRRTGDDGDLEKGKPDSPPRYTDNGDGTITDHATGLMWVKEPGVLGGNFGSAGTPSQMTWNNAIDECLALTYGGHSDWYLPNCNQLVTIYWYVSENPPLDPTFFPSTQLNWYWASTTPDYNITQAMMVRFSFHGIARTSKSQSQYLRPVRGPI